MDIDTRGDSSPVPPGPRFRRAAGLLGFALGGFFDGILLHQILQWHHLLSAVTEGPLGDLRGQVVADGVFHALMYLVAALGLWLLVKARGDLARPGAARAFLAAFLIGFGMWHIVDALFSHWLTGIHRIRMDSPDPLLWDLLWLGLFGLIPFAAGLLLRRRTAPGGQGGPGDKGPRAATTLPLVLLGVTLGAGLVSARPPAPGEGTVTVVLRPGIGPERLLASLAASDSRIVWNDATGSVWVLQPEGDSRLLDYYRQGAMYVSGSLMPAGCSAWLRTGRDERP